MSWILFAAQVLLGLILFGLFLFGLFMAHQERELNIQWFRKYVAKSKEEADEYAERLRRQWP